MQTPYRAITCAYEIISPERQGGKEPKKQRNEFEKSQVEIIQLKCKKNIFKYNGKFVVEVRT